MGILLLYINVYMHGSGQFPNEEREKKVHFAYAIPIGL